MHPSRWLCVGTLALTLAACSGDDGKSGATGPVGPAGTSVGRLTGTITTDALTGEVPVEGVTVAVSPDAGVAAATTDASGVFTLDLPVGVYAVTFSKSPGIAAVVEEGVSVVAGRTLTLDKKVAYSPITLKITGPAGAALPAPAGLSTEVNLAASATGATGPVTYTWTLVSGPFKTDTKPQLAATAETAKFTTNSLAQMIASGVVNNPPLDLQPRMGVVSISPSQVAKMAYVVKVTANDGKFTQSATATVNSMPLSPGLANYVAKGVLLVLNDAAAETYAWQLTAKPAGSTAALANATTRNPTFTPDLDGKYTVKNGATELTIVANSYRGAGVWAHADGAVSGQCADCHDAAMIPEVAEWQNSAHGNHFFKFMDYVDGELVWTGAAKAPTADEGTYWDRPGRMTTFEFGLTGAEGSHYGASCVACHTTGYNAAGVNGGFDDVAKDKGWKFPDLKTVLGGDHATPAPVMTAWNDPTVPKAFAGMQCESCHGPMKTHWSTVEKPGAFYNVDTCAFCHDRPANHDRVTLWRQSAHAVLSNGEYGAFEIGEEASCSKCHSAQGHKLWADAGYSKTFSPPNVGGVATGWDKSDVQPITCQACHDPHTTKLRLTGEEPLALMNGYTVEGVGAGAGCMVCHNSRKGRHDDMPGSAGPNGQGPHESSQADVLLGVNAYFMPTQQTSAHLSVGETCVGCHVTLKDALGNPVTAGPAARATNHTFAIDGRSCASCHNPGITAEAIEGQFKQARADLYATILKYLQDNLPSPYGVVAQRPEGLANFEAENTPAYIVLTQEPTALYVRPYHPYATFVFTFAAPVTTPWGDVTELWVKAKDIDLDPATPPTFDRGPDGLGEVEYSIGADAMFPVHGTMAKALWNVTLLNNDASNGIHNPSFAFDVLAASRAQVAAMPPLEAQPQ